MDKKDAAKQLYLESWDQARIAATLGITQNTVSKWKKKHDWDKEKIKKAAIAQESTDRVWAMIDYQTKALEAQKEEFLKKGEEDGTYKLIGRGNLDALQKLFSIVKTKETKWLDTIKVASEILEFVQSQNLKLAKSLSPLITEFIEEKRTSNE